MDMRVYVLRRLLQGALTLLLVSIAIFAALRAAPGDAADLIAAGGAGAEAAAQAGSEDQRSRPCARNSASTGPNGASTPAGSPTWSPSIGATHSSPAAASGRSSSNGCP